MEKSFSLKKHIIPTMVIFVTVVIAVVVTAYMTYLTATQSLLETTVQNASELVAESASSINLRIEERCEMLFVCADILGKPNVTSGEMQAILGFYSESKIFDFVQYYAINGGFLSSGDAMPLLKQSEVVGIASRGENHVLFSDETSEYNYYIVPVTDTENEVIGGVVGAVGKDSFSNDINSCALSHYGQIFICDENGRVVFSSDPENNLFSVGLNILAQGVLDDASKTRLKTAFAMIDQNGCIDSVVGTTPHTLIYSSVNSQGWAIVTLIHPDYIAEKYNTVSHVMFSFVGLFSLVLLMYMAFIFIQFLRVRAQLADFAAETRNETEIDSITGYMSDKSFKKKCQQRLVDFSMNYALISIDIDKFKTINEKLGYDGGNSIIKRFADIINRNVGPDDIFTRDTGDLFYILCTYATDDSLSDKIRDIIADMDYQITECKLSLSAGIYLIKNRSMSIRAICDRSNIARRSIKENVTRHFAFFDNSMLDELKAEHEIESVMEEALEKREFLVYLQPKFNLHTDNFLVGAEALVRWQHGDRFITPGEFIPCFEKNGFVKKLDFYMFEEVCRLQRRWLSNGLTLNVISVNMSRLHLHDEDFVDTLVDICGKYSIPTCYFEIEITESAADENLDVLVGVFNGLRKGGFKISIDDFGTGYSSLNMLKDLPVDVLKIDREFLGKNSSESAKIIIAHVISLAMSLNIKTICEGIETEEQAQLLDELGCNMAQGFFFARPMPVEDYEKLAYKLNEKNAARKGNTH